MLSAVKNILLRKPKAIKQWDSLSGQDILKLAADNVQEFYVSGVEIIGRVDGLCTKTKLFRIYATLGCFA